MCVSSLVQIRQTFPYPESCIHAKCKPLSLTLLNEILIPDTLCSFVLPLVVEWHCQVHACTGIKTDGSQVRLDVIL